MQRLFDVEGKRLAYMAMYFKGGQRKGELTDLVVQAADLTPPSQEKSGDAKRGPETKFKRGSQCDLVWCARISLR